MFTGIITEIGKIQKIERGGGDTAFSVRAPATAKNLKVGNSVALNGACHTVVQRFAQTFVVESIPETLRRTNLGDWKIGSLVNLERPVGVSGSFDGHFVSGHIDGVAPILKIEQEQNSKIFTLQIPARLACFVVEKGSITLDGVSLTIISIRKNRIQVGIIPHTLAVTNFGTRKVGERLNIETDLLAKHVAKLLRK